MMSKKAPFIFLFLVLCLGLAYLIFFLPKQKPVRDIPAFKRGERVLILAPHPDDEAIGCAGVIQQALSAGAEVQVAYLTNGDHNQFAFIVYEKRITFMKSEFIHLGGVRRKEAIKAMESLGLDQRNLVFLGYPDFGTFEIFSQYWQTQTPYRSLLTRITHVPYKECLSFGAAYLGENILSDLEKVIRDFAPQKIFVSHPADVNGDHKTLYLFLEVALADLKKEIPAPKVYPYLIHRRSWPLPRHYRPKLSLEPPKEFTDSDINWEQFRLDPKQLDKKYRAILAYRSQTASSAFYLLSFARKNELFSDFPEVSLQKQGFLKAKEASFCGYSKLFPASETEICESLDELIAQEMEVSYAVVENSLLVRVMKPESSNRRFNSMFYLFGYSYKTPFSAMPKIRIASKYNEFRVFEKKTLIENSGIELELNAACLILRIPLKLLGEPDFILTSVKTSGGSLPVDASSFRKVNIRK